jgi:putative glycosyltransferase (TIGR04372 family)
VAFEYKYFAMGRRPVILIKIRSTGLGHLPMGLLQGFHMARATGAKAYFFAPAQSLNPAFFHLDTRDVSLLHRSWWRRVLYSLVWEIDETWRFRVGRAASRFRAGVTESVNVMTHAFRRRDLRAVDLRSSSKKPAPRLAEYNALDHCRPSKPPHLGLDLRKLYCQTAVAVEFPKRLDLSLAREAAEYGIVGRPIVTMHARESGYLSSLGYKETQKERDRNVDIETYIPAIEFLVDHGYVVVRIGDPTMKPLVKAGVVDVATFDRDTRWLQLWAVLNSRFFVGCNSGPSFIPLLTNTPTLLTNITNPLKQYAARTRDRIILKGLSDPRAGGVLPLTAMLRALYVDKLHRQKDVAWVDNTANDILEAVKEMCEVLGGATTPATSQVRFKAELQAIRSLPRISSMLALKGSPDPTYLGEGYIARSFADRYLELDQTLDKHKPETVNLLPS